ncbi:MULTISPECIES: sensor histidine kinase [unclassified Flavobacterium]|uniref:sensor histidine kinase n=1 Tax=unclassified Flavobacterium TaxID=196869 RepID=UPI0012A9287A|nr:MULTISPECIES: histidine kinase [unclassified Flavobacterium]MBF4487399.1 histidine kinase [Flavobacterium sp. CSZ]QGK75463.1 GHKL domain-containing protein [Flavobacterium sp. SLB02]
MKILKIYQNFFLRNIIVNAFIILVILACVYDEIKLDGRDWSYMLSKIAVGYLPCIIWVTIFNVFIIRPFLFKRKLKTFFTLFVIYWTSFYFFMNWFFPLVGLGNFKTLQILSLIINGMFFYFIHVVITKKIRDADKDIMNFKSELSFLKQQLNPHFLLNAMNNLYGESLSDPDKLPDRILNLSDMLRYQIEATKKDYVFLEEEIAFIKKYIEYYTFQNERLVVTQLFEGDYDNIDIPPLFFLPLVENAVKFSAETPKPFINIDLKVKCNQLSFTLKNNYLESGSRLSSTGIGIENLKRRLEVYGLRHELNCKKEKNIFMVKLKIWHLPTAVLS